MNVRLFLHVLCFFCVSHIQKLFIFRDVLMYLREKKMNGVVLQGAYGKKEATFLLFFFVVF